MWQRRSGGTSSLARCQPRWPGCHSGSRRWTSLITNCRVSGVCLAWMCSCLLGMLCVLWNGNQSCHPGRLLKADVHSLCTGTIPPSLVLPSLLLARLYGNQLIGPTVALGKQPQLPGLSILGAVSMAAVSMRPPCGRSHWRPTPLSGQPLLLCLVRCAGSLPPSWELADGGEVVVLPQNGTAGLCGEVRCRRRPGAGMGSVQMRAS